MLIALMRSVTEVFGATLGAALVYSLGALLLFLKQGIPDLKTLSKPYLFIGGSPMNYCSPNPSGLPMTASKRWKSGLSITCGLA